VSDFTDDDTTDANLNDGSVDSVIGAPLLVPLARDAVHARNRPLAITGYYVWQAGLGAVAAWPFVSVVRSVYGQHPEGDAPLWHPGLLEWLDLAAHSRAAISAVLTHATLVVVLGLVMSIIPTAALIASIAFTTSTRRSPSFRAAVIRAIESFPAILAVSLITWILQAIVIASAFASFEAITSSFAQRWGEPRADQVAAGVSLFILAFACIIGVIYDLACAAVVRFKSTTFDAIRVAIESFRARPFVVLWSWAWRVGAGFVPLIIGALVANHLGGRGGSAVIALFALHQSVVLSRAIVHASWFSEMIRAVLKPVS
jgi:hypothetical protein